MKSLVHPELVTGRDDGFVARAWTVKPGSTQRGSASCNLSDRILEVPLGPDATSRVVRAHELMHARVSPHVLVNGDALDGLAPRALECAEELRVNVLVARLGFDTDLLHDGSEKSGGRRLGEADDWSEAVCFLMAVVATGAEKGFLAGVRLGRASWLPALRTLRKRALSLMDQFDTESLGATRLNEDQLPVGYAAVTVTLARVLTEAMSARPPSTPLELQAFRRSLVPGGRRASSGRFAPLVFDDTLEMTSRPRSSGVRRHRPSASGVEMRFPSRLLTDPQRRAFARRTSVPGGIALIDQSGSMDLDPEELAGLLRRAPNAVVVGYSHRPGDLGGTANVWLLAERGAVARTCPSGNIGNGVDGPVLRWALARRRGREPIVWITDGQITDSNDHPVDALTTECALLVARHDVILVREVADAAPAVLRGTAKGPSDWPQFGRLGRKLVEMHHFSMSQG